VLLAIASPLLAAEGWTIVGSDFQSHPAAIQSIDDRGVKIVVDGKTQAVNWDTLLELDRPAVARSVAGGFSLYLATGDCVSGEPVALDGEKLTWKNSVMGEIAIPATRVSAIARTGRSIGSLDESRSGDVVRLANGDSATGVITAITKESVTLHSADTDNTINFDQIAAVLLANPPPPAGKRAFRISINDGSTVTVNAVDYSSAIPDKLSIALTNKDTRQIDLAVVDSIEQLAGPILWLTSIAPMQSVYKPYFEENFPPRFDQPVGEPGLTIRQKYPSHRHGIGVHAYTNLTYAIPAGYSTFRTQYAIDPPPTTDAPLADVTVRILVDDKKRFETPHVRQGKPADPVTVDVIGGHTLSLEVDYGDNLAAQDRFVWLDPALVKVVPIPTSLSPR
jgi:hypothetical protein